MARGKTKDNRIYYRLLGVVFVMILFGLIMVLSASWVRAYAETGDSYYYIKRQLLWIAMGSVALLFFSRVSVGSFQKLARPVIVAAIVMLLMVLVPGVGKTAGGASRWILVGGFQIQPSELAKFAVALYTADFLTRKRKELGDIKELIYPYGVVLLLIIFLVLKQPDLGTTLAICMAAFVILFIGGFPLKYVLGIGVTGIAAGAYFIYFSPFGFHLKRFKAFLDPKADPFGAGYQILQSLIAFGSGGLFGVGLGMSRQKYFYLPAAQTDFIFAIIGEELGLLGTLFTVLLFALFTYYGIKISYRCKNHFGRLLGAGLTSMIALQALVNMGAVTAMLPITGIPMPFISYGGSSLIVNLASVGILLSIATDNNSEASSRKRRPRLTLVKGEGSKGKKATKKKAGKNNSSRRSAASTSRMKLVASSKKRPKASSKAKSAGAASTSATKKRARRTKTNEGSDKRRRNSGTRVSGSSARRRPTGDKRKR
ncbi:MAG TPA: putative lipid II flippase FtsW [Anaerolineae bacterium]|jgi:cell division protein FtsW|nr:putative lipid II flippase FtsW [Anaerolineae bacterium]